MNKLHVAFVVAASLLSAMSYSVDVINQIDKPVVVITPQPEVNVKNPFILKGGNSQKLASRSLKLTLLGRDFEINELGENEQVTVAFNRENPSEILILRLPQPTVIARFKWSFPTTQPKKEERSAKG